MKLLTYKDAEKDGELLPGLLLAERMLDIPSALMWAQSHGLIKEAMEDPPRSVIKLLEAGPAMLEKLSSIERHFMRLAGKELFFEGKPLTYAKESVRLAAPLPRPSSLRDFYAFEAHVKMAWGKRNRPVPEGWYHFPVFYFCNHNSVIGPEEPLHSPSATRELDFELEVACVIGKKGINIKREEAHAYIAGYTIMNDWSARDIQREEMKVRLGPAKGKDFATSLGPYLVTADELENRRDGERYDLLMEARVNGELYSRGNLKDIYWSFPQMIARASQDAALYPGDVIGSGTVGTGCLLELGRPWLKPGDIVEFSVEKLGTLRNRIV